MNKQQVEILLIEDNPGDVRLLQEVFCEGKLIKNLHVVYDGVEATDYLYQQNKYTSASKPDLIILDLNLPKKNGREVLFEIKTDENLKKIPVIILTSSKVEEDIVKTYNLHANCYLIKPLNLNEFYGIVNSIENFWLNFKNTPHS